MCPSAVLSEMLHLFSLWNKAADVAGAHASRCDPVNAAVRNRSPESERNHTDAHEYQGNDDIRVRHRKGLVQGVIHDHGEQALDRRRQSGQRNTFEMKE